ncbi:hypothetical protein [Gordonia sihwensis]|uniref:hypothetical protein n=1 Tax=Gordonia sihwensis TaxID=173559 RepID=UPI002415F91E|nr:hypothetical protein [Gordonia sihwensis]WFN94138.1 hypothetical protein P5P27_06225 [Gordonia sihwensis]WFN94199.1 hypothetical protein P5P27_06535 [Gordonia sihwensis]
MADQPATASNTQSNDMKALDPEQRARVAALRAANGVLAATGFARREAVDPIDLVSVAQYIVTGDDPWPSTADVTATRITEGDHQ